MCLFGTCNPTWGAWVECGMEKQGKVTAQTRLGPVTWKVTAKPETSVFFPALPSGAPACLPLFPLLLTPQLLEGFPFPSGGGPLLSAVFPSLPFLTLPWAPVLHTQVSARVIDPWL